MSDNFIVDCKKNIDEFKKTVVKGPFKHYLDEKTTLEKSTDIEVYCAAIYQGYLDACRTFKMNELPLMSDPYEATIEGLAHKVADYLGTKTAIFDHDAFCEVLVSRKRMSYGHAQKIVNMAFKYLCCLPGAENYADKFKVCHMPLDSIMLEWLVRECEKHGDKIKRGRMPAWSSIEGKEDAADSYGYSFYVAKIEEISGGKAPLQLDFENWENMKMRLSAEAFLKAYFPSDMDKREYMKKIKAMDYIDLMTAVRNVAQAALGE